MAKKKDNFPKGTVKELIKGTAYATSPKKKAKSKKGKASAMNAMKAMAMDKMGMGGKKPC